VENGGGVRDREKVGRGHAHPYLMRRQLPREIAEGGRDIVHDGVDVTTEPGQRRRQRWTETTQRRACDGRQNAGVDGRDTTHVRPLADNHFLEHNELGHLHR
jgi:hypothetical protein